LFVKDKERNESENCLKGIFNNSKKLFKVFNGKEYKAILLTSGRIKYKNKIFETPTAAAKAASRRKNINGYNFWHIQNDSGDWIKLSNFKK